MAHYADLGDRLESRLAKAGPRALKPHRGNDGQGVMKVTAFSGRLLRTPGSLALRPVWSLAAIWRSRPQALVSRTRDQNAQQDIIQASGRPAVLRSNAGQQDVQLRDHLRFSPILKGRADAGRHARCRGLRLTPGLRDCPVCRWGWDCSQVSGTGCGRVSGQTRLDSRNRTRIAAAVETPHEGRRSGSRIGRRSDSRKAMSGSLTEQIVGYASHRGHVACQYARVPHLESRRAPNALAPY